MISLSPSQTRLVEAATTCFVRYGLRKTTMSDIAQEAGVSRPTLYAHYRSKDEILTATLLHMGARSLEDTRKAWAHQTRLDDMLDAYFDTGVRKAFALLQTATDARDLISGHNEAGRAALLQVQIEKRNALIEILEPYQSALADHGQRVDQLAHYIVVAGTQLKYVAVNEEDLDELIATLIATILAVTGAHARNNSDAPAPHPKV